MNWALKVLSDCLASKLNTVKLDSTLVFEILKKNLFFHIHKLYPPRLQIASDNNIM